MKKSFRLIFTNIGVHYDKPVEPIGGVGVTLPGLHISLVPEKTVTPSVTMNYFNSFSLKY